MFHCQTRSYSFEYIVHWTDFDLEHYYYSSSTEHHAPQSITGPGRKYAMPSAEPPASQITWRARLRKSASPMVKPHTPQKNRIRKKVTGTVGGSHAPQKTCRARLRKSMMPSAEQPASQKTCRARLRKSMMPSADPPAPQKTCRTKVKKVCGTVSGTSYSTVKMSS